MGVILTTYVRPGGDPPSTSRVNQQIGTKSPCFLGKKNHPKHIGGKVEPHGQFGWSISSRVLFVEGGPKGQLREARLLKRNTSSIWVFPKIGVGTQNGFSENNGKPY